MLFSELHYYGTDRKLDIRHHVSLQSKLSWARKVPTVKRARAIARRMSKLCMYYMYMRHGVNKNNFINEDDLMLFYFKMICSEVTHYSIKNM